MPRENRWIVVLLTFLWVAPVALAESEKTPAPEYELGVEDRLFISVWKEPDLTLTVTIRPDGRITVPLVGDLMAAGLSPTELSARLTAELGTYVKSPVVTVIVEGIENFKVYVLGEVGSQGMLTLRRRTRLLQAIAQSGGLTEFADKSNIILVREKYGQETRIPIDYRKLVSGKQPELNMYLQPGDTILVN
jgi:polysaccharide export outer membrane protein